MYKILHKETLNEVTKLMVVAAPEVARKAQAGQFVIVRVDERGERIPLTFADYDREAGTVTLIMPPSPGHWATRPRSRIMAPSYVLRGGSLSLPSTPSRGRSKGRATPSFPSSAPAIRTFCSGKTGCGRSATN
jgi:hypothetical protein